MMKAGLKNTEGIFYVKVHDNIWVKGKICEIGISGATGYYALVETTTKYTIMKTLIHSVGQIRRQPPQNVVILGV